MARDNTPKKGGRQRRLNTAKELPPDLYERYKSDPEETYHQRKTQIQWIRRYWVEEWFNYRFVTKECAKKNAKKAPWLDIIYKNLHPNTKVEAIQIGFYSCMVRPPMPEQPDPSSILGRVATEDTSDEEDQPPVARQKPMEKAKASKTKAAKASRPRASPEASRSRPAAAAETEEVSHQYETEAKTSRCPWTEAIHLFDGCCQYD